ncbi:MAG TPA: histidine phosphatase family protein [Acholeplasmataceae bacterium]|jgi:2,3-bisphosphoglycerate-dependent phosphoglycerate mutase|nr:histidine phosphatase family protein [Acholeplasmataceae bacterium]
MQLILLRHGQSVADILNVIEGRADFELTLYGKIQVEETAKKLSRLYKINKIYSSTLKRARQTAEILNKHYQLDIVYLDDLMEFNNGLIAGLTREEADRLYPKDENLPFDKAMYGMESQKDFRLRAEKVLNHIISNAEENDIIAIVSHGGMINRLYQAFLKMPLQAVVSYPSGDAKYHIWSIEKGIRKIISSNN